jgi:hypothetical protein
MIDPKLEQYPKWLREEIYPEVSLQRDYYHDMRFKENEEALRKIFTTINVNPLHRILFAVVIETIRMKFKLYALQKRCDRLEGKE